MLPCFNHKIIIISNINPTLIYAALQVKKKYVIKFLLMSEQDEQPSDSAVCESGLASSGLAASSPPRKANHHSVLEKIQNTAALIHPRGFQVRKARLLRRDNTIFWSSYYWWKRKGRRGNEQQKLDDAFQLHQ